MKNRAFYMSGLELGILLNSMGIQRCFCFDLKLNTELTRKEIIRAVYALSKRRWIEVEDCKIQVQSQIAEIINGMKKAEYILLLSAERGDSLAYLGKTIVTVSAVADNQYRLQERTGNLNSFIEWIEEEGGIQEEADENGDMEAARNNQICKEREMLYKKNFSIFRKVASIKSMDSVGKEVGLRVQFLQGLMNEWIVSETLDGVVVRVAVDCTAERRRLYEFCKELKT